MRTLLSKHVRLIRHGESAANAGATTQDHASIPLTAKGLEQARQVALSFTEAPGLIIASPFSRAHATAAWTMTVFPSCELQTWPIQEFTYLEPARCVNTTVAQRKEWVIEYWDRADPLYIDGEGAESFAAFIARARSFLDRLADNQHRSIAVFSHGQFLNAIAWLIERKPSKIDGHSMTDWRAYQMLNHVGNCCGYQLISQLNGAGWTLKRPKAHHPQGFLPQIPFKRLMP